MIQERRSIVWRILMTLILAGLCVGMMAYPAMADGEAERFTIVCSAGDGFYIPDGMAEYPVRISVSNNGADFHGVIKLMMYTGDNMKETVAYVQKAVIPAGETESFKFNVQNIYFDLSSYKIPVRIELLDENGNQVSCQTLEFQVTSDGSAIFLGGVVSRNDQISQLMNASGFDYETDYVCGRVTMQGINLTSEDIMVMDLSRADMLVLDMDVTDEAWEKILDWLMKDGHLMMSREVYDVRIGKTLDDDAMTTWGTGRVLVYDSEKKWSGTELIRSIKALFGPTGMSALLEGDDNFWRITNQLSYDMWSKTPKIGGYLIVLFIYILLMGPAAYVFLSRGKDRREYMWGVIPCLAIVFSLIIYQLGSAVRYSDTFVRYGSIVRLTDEGTVEDTRMMVISPDTEHTMVTLEGKCSLIPLFEDYYWGSNGSYYGDGNLKDDRSRARLMTEEYDLAITSSEEKTDILINSGAVFDNSYFSVSRILENDGELKADLQFYRGCFNGTIRNTTPWNLKNVWIAYHGIGMVLGELPAGQSVALNQAEADIVLIPYADSFDLDPTVYGPDANQTAARWIMSNLIDNSGMLRDSSCAVMAGFTEDYDIGIEDSGEIESVNGMALIVQNIAVQSSGRNWSSQALVHGTGVSEDDEMNYDTYSYMIYSSDVININYQLDGVGCPDYIKWLNHDPNVHIAFYNYGTGNYDSVFEDSYVLSGDELTPYLDEQYHIMAQVQADDMGYNSYIPGFTVTGGEADD